MSDQVAEGTILERTSRSRRRQLVARMYLCLVVFLGAFAIPGEPW